MFQTEQGRSWIWRDPNKDSYFVKYTAHTASLPTEKERSLAKTKIGGGANWRCGEDEGPAGPRP